MTEDSPLKYLIPLGVALLTLWLTPAGMFNFYGEVVNQKRVKEML